MSYTCACCGETFENESMGEYDVHGLWVCNSCIDSDYTRCEDCDELVPDDEVEEVNGHYYCSCCAESHNYENNGICNYHAHHSADPIFYGDTENNAHPYLGVELEVDMGGYYDDVADEVKNIMGYDFIYQESDGSIDDGFENITQPATLKYHESKEDDYHKMFRYLVHKGYRSHNTRTCGLHVHFNRSFFDNKDEYIENLLYIMDKFWNEMSKFSRRTNNRLNEWARKHEKTPTEIIIDMHNHNETRYYAINLTNNDTIEFRMFRGTLNPNSFFATLEMVDNIVTKAKYCTKEELENMTFEDLLTTDRLKAYWETVKNRTV